MSVSRQEVIDTLSDALPRELVEGLVREYESLKTQFALGRFRPAELDGGRFSEYVVRILQYLEKNTYTPLGANLHQTGSFLEQMSKSPTLQGSSSLTFFIPRLILLLMGVRNRRDVAHIGGEVSPNYSDARFICYSADWIMTELIRRLYSCTPDEAKRIVLELNTTRLPIIEEVGVLRRVLNTKLETRLKVLALLYHEHPTPVGDEVLQEWTDYKNKTRFTKILQQLDKEALIVRQGGFCHLTLKGIQFVEKYIPQEVEV